MQSCRGGYIIHTSTYLHAVVTVLVLVHTEYIHHTPYYMPGCRYIHTSPCMYILLFNSEWAQPLPIKPLLLSSMSARRVETNKTQCVRT